MYKLGDEFAGAGAQFTTIAAHSKIKHRQQGGQADTLRKACQQLCQEHCDGMAGIGPGKEKHETHAIILELFEKNFDLSL
jgi:hypothetical protein